jgi:hypothetical protein
VFLTNGDMCEIKTRSTKVSSLMEEFKERLAKSRKDKLDNDNAAAAAATPTTDRINIQTLPFPGRWLLVMDEEGMYTQPFNYGFGSFVGHYTAQMYGPLLLVRTSEKDDEYLTSLPALPEALPENAEGDAEEMHLEALAKAVKPFRAAYQQGARDSAARFQKLESEGFKVIHIN